LAGELGEREQPVGVPGRPVGVVAVDDSVDDMMCLGGFVEQVRDVVCAHEANRLTPAGPILVSMKRAILIVNPFSTGVTEARVAAIEDVLRSRVELETQYTEARGHAMEIAAAAGQNADAVIVFSGDGTYN